MFCRGPQCQYPVERCAPSKLNFNGGYNCTGSSDYISCTLKCKTDAWKLLWWFIFCFLGPGGAKFTYEPADEYKCMYETGEFVPSTTPKCLYRKYLNKT